MDELLFADVIYKQSGSASTDIQDVAVSLVQRAYIGGLNRQVNILIVSRFLVKPVEPHSCADPHLSDIFFQNGSDGAYSRIQTHTSCFKIDTLQMIISAGPDITVRIFLDVKYILVGTHSRNSGRGNMTNLKSFPFFYLANA